MKRGTIVVKPFNRKYLGSNSYDVHLGDWLAMYNEETLDCKKHNKVHYFKVPKERMILAPSKLYLGVTKEYTESHARVPFLERKSSIGRLGIDIHATAGKGDVGFCNTWTLEISVKQPVQIYAGMPTGQLIYFEISGDVEVLYSRKKTAEYKRQMERPVESTTGKSFRSVLWQ